MRVVRRGERRRCNKSFEYTHTHDLPRLRLPRHWHWHPTGHITTNHSTAFRHSTGSMPGILKRDEFIGWLEKKWEEFEAAGTLRYGSFQTMFSHNVSHILWGSKLCSGNFSKTSPSPSLPPCPALNSSLSTPSMTIYRGTTQDTGYHYVCIATDSLSSYVAQRENKFNKLCNFVYINTIVYAFLSCVFRTK